MREKDNFYFNRMLMKVLKEKGTGRYCWINVPRLLDEVKKYDCNGSLIQKKVELAEEDENTEVISQRTIKRVIQYCEGYIADQERNDYSVTMKTIKTLGKALCNDENAFLVDIQQENILKLSREAIALYANG